MTFNEVLSQTIAMLQQHGRVSYRALKRQFAMDDTFLEDLKYELIEVQQRAVDRDGIMLVWTGDASAAATPIPTPSPSAAVPPVGTSQKAEPLAYTPPHLAEKIRIARAALEGERKQVTVLFADLKASMELLADRDPEEARRLLDPVLERMLAAVHRNEGTVNQIMGDGIMALFGAPIAHEDHAVRACYAALAMQAALRSYSDEVRRAHGVAVHFRVGLNSGEVVVRAIDNDLHMDYSAIGQTVHLAARMAQLATPGSILLTPATLRLVEGLVRVNALGPIPVKGLEEPVEVYELVGASALRRRLQAAVERGLTQFVGRQHELDTLHQALEHAGAGHGQVVAVVGEAGVGKSRLVYECIRSHRTRARLVLESASVSYGSLLLERWRRLHARIVEALEALSTERLAEQVDSLAHHALRGEMWDKAVIYCQQAGARAHGRAAFREAAAHCEQGLTLAEELGMRPLQAHCHHGLGRLYGQTGRGEQARAALTAAIELYRAMDMTFWLPQAEAALAQLEAR